MRYMKLIGIVLVATIFACIIFDPTFTVIAGIKGFEFMFLWCVANVICKTCFRRSLIDILFDDTFGKGGKDNEEN